jgi:hypothetical protein
MEKVDQAEYPDRTCPKDPVDCQLIEYKNEVIDHPFLDGATNTRFKAGLKASIGIHCQTCRQTWGQI